jgi:DNA-binding MarR family transcriptional regulator
MGRLLKEAEVITDAFNEIHALLRRTSRRDIAGIGLTAPQVDLLRQLSFNDGLTLTQLSERLNLAHSTVSGIVDRLEQKEMVERRPDPHDRRIKSIFLGQPVREYLQHHVSSARANLMIGALQDALPAERAQIVAGMATLLRLLKRRVAQSSAQDAVPLLPKVEL